jgi:hypothetical protein
VGDTVRQKIGHHLDGLEQILLEVAVALAIELGKALQRKGLAGLAEDDRRVAADQRIGAGAGLLAGLGLMAIPGIGPVVAAGWLVATAAGAVCREN